MRAKRVGVWQAREGQVSGHRLESSVGVVEPTPPQVLRRGLLRTTLWMRRAVPCRRRMATASRAPTAPHLWVPAFAGTTIVLRWFGCREGSHPHLNPLPSRERRGSPTPRTSGSPVSGTGQALPLQGRRVRAPLGGGGFGGGLGLWRWCGPGLRGWRRLRRSGRTGGGRGCRGD